MAHPVKAPLIAAALAGAVLWSSGACAGNVTLALVRATLSNDQDADGGGLWQYEGGAVQNASGNAVGTYIIQRRITTSGTQTYNTAGETISLFFAPTKPDGLPATITVEGDYSYNTGAVGGAVAAASSKYHWIIGADANATVVTGTSTTSLVLAWTASDSLRVP